MLGGQAERAVPHPAHVAFGDGAEGPENQGEPGVGQILHGRAVVDPLARVRGQDLAQRPDQPEGRVPGRPGLLGDEGQVQPGGIGMGSDRVRGGAWDQPDVGLGLRQRGQDVQPGLGPALVGEQR